MSEKRYLCVQRSVGAAGNVPSPEEMQQLYARFTEWRKKFEDNIVDLGGKLGTGKLATVDGVLDGHFVESKELIGGYMILSAESLDKAVDVARQCPGLVSPGSAVEVREIRTQ